ncbi:MAG: hypothetical protein HOP16_17510 [Acidobacteria bacterium]|nr:hypothetical protein [Acidobacteriota bacterium]
MNALFRAAADFEAFCVTRGWSCCVIGGLAVQRWGEPRQTRDVDLTLLTGLGGEERFIDPILAHYAPRVPDARRFAIERRVLLVETADRIPLDISLGGLPFEAGVVARASAFVLAPDAALTTCSAEDLLVLKAFAGRPQDWLDIEGVVVRQGERLDRELVLAELRPLLDLKEDSQTEPRLLALFSKHPY